MKMSASAIVRLENVTLGYYTIPKGWRSLFKIKQPVVFNVNLNVIDGEKVVIIGESGSGKTTLLKTILGILPPFEGKVYVLGKSIYDLPVKERRKITRQIGYVPQDPYKSLNPRVKVETVMMEPLERSNLTESEKRERIVEALRLVQLHERILEYYPMQLSGGMMQRVLIARAIVHDPEILILDEPTSALDVSIQAQVINLLNHIQKKLELAMLTVTHDLAVAQYLADRVIILYRGRIVEEGETRMVLSQPSHEYTRLLISSYRASI